MNDKMAKGGRGVRGMREGIGERGKGIDWESMGQGGGEGRGNERTSG